MNRLCYISRCYRDRRSAGNRAKTDNETTFSEMGAVNLGMPQRIASGKVTTFFYDLLSVARFAVNIRKGDRLLLQYPIKKYYTLICRIAHHRGAKVVTFIHDLGSCRRKKLTIAQEMRRLSHSDALIAANPTMERWFIDNGYKGITTSSGLHDYRSLATPVERTASELPVVIYAGSINHRKNSFLIKFCATKRHFKLRIYGDCGNMPEITTNEQTTLCNFAEPDAFIANANGDYGLVWDGNSMDGCSGSFGEYLSLNTPHKASFYILAGLPLIVWDRSALAPIVKQEGIGFAVGKLDEIDKVLSTIGNRQQQQMQARAVQLSRRLKKGDNLRSAISTVLRQIP